MRISTSPAGYQLAKRASRRRHAPAFLALLPARDPCLQLLLAVTTAPVADDKVQSCMATCKAVISLGLFPCTDIAAGTCG